MSRFANAAATVPEPCRILGTALRPFCLGHHLLFKRLELPFAGNAGDPMAKCDSADIVAGIAICASPNYEFTLDLMLRGKWEAFFADWMKRVKGHWWRRRKVDWSDVEALFRAYLSDGYQSAPVMRYKNAHGIKMSAPWEEMLKCHLVMAGFSESESLNGYMPGRWYDYYTVLELRRAETCKDTKHWHRIFYTAEENAMIKGGDNAR